MLVALLVATTISLELTVMLSKSILRPLRDLSRAVERIDAGDFDVSVPVTTGDELGELAASFNEMVDGLAERERIREAFGTYLDKEVAEYILSEGFTEEGVEIEVSVLFCDVRDFTAFASDATPAEVVAALNRLFEVIVPIIAAPGRPHRQVRGRRPARRLRRPGAVPRPRRPRRARRVRDRRRGQRPRRGRRAAGRRRRQHAAA